MHRVCPPMLVKTFHPTIRFTPLGSLFENLTGRQLKSVAFSEVQTV